MNKKELRKLYREKREAICSEELDILNKDIMKVVYSLPILQYENHLCFYPILSNKEVNTIPLIEYLWENNKNVFLPKMEGENMKACLFSGGTDLRKNEFNIWEPKDCNILEMNDLDIIYLPMFICDIQGNRVGYGGGYYDRYLQNSTSDLVKIGLNFFAPISKKIPINKQDISLDYCVSPDLLSCFSSKL